MASYSCKIPDEADGVGTVQCGSFRAYTMGFHVSILRANQQIYREAWSMFQLGNFWTLVQMNKTGFGKEMKDLGFAIASAGDLSRHVKFPVLKVGIIFPSLEGQSQSDTLVVATVHLKHLIRCLWTCKGASEMEITIHVQPPITKISPDERHLLRPFFKLRGVKKLTVLGVSKERYIDELTRLTTTIDGINQTFGELVAGIKCLQRYIKARRWDHATAMAEKHTLLMHDTQAVYGNRFVGVEPGLIAHMAIERSKAAQEIIIAGAMAVAEVTLHLRQFANTVCFATRAIDLMTRASLIQVTPAILLPPPNLLLPVPGIVFWNRQTKSFIHLVRARAHIAMGRAELALFDIAKARGFVDDSAMLTSVSKAWQVRFGPYPALSVPIVSASAWSARAAALGITLG